MIRRTRFPRAPLLLAILTFSIVQFGCSRGGASEAILPDLHFERIATLVGLKMKEYGIPGVALGISYLGTKQMKGFGITSFDNPLPVTESTFFQAGSITKTFTSTIVMRLVEAGRLKLDAPVRDYMPTFRVADEFASQRATVRTLLTHMGGWEGDYFEDAGDGVEALAEYVKRMAILEQVAPFDTMWSYNNAGFCVAGRLIEIVTGKTYEAVVNELLIEPLRFRQTCFFPADVMTYRFVVGHAGAGDRQIVLRPWGLPRSLHPAGGIIASVSDLLGYAEFHLGNGSSPAGSRLLSPDSMRQLQEILLVKQGTNEGMALGWQVSSIGPLKEIWHDGAAVGQHALLSLVPSKQLAIVLLTNSVRGERFNREIKRAVIEEYLAVTISDPAPIMIPQAELAQYAGRYSRPFMDIVVAVDSDRIMIQRIQKQGFPTSNSPVPPPPPPTPYAFCAKDRLIGLGPVEGELVEFLRRPDGSIGWIRAGGRVARRVS